MRLLSGARVVRWMTCVVMIQCATACTRLSDISGPRPLDAPVVSVELTGGPVTLAEGATLALVVTARDADNRPLPDRVVAWSSSDPMVATVSNVGLVTALRPGVVQIAASVDGRSATVQITITTRAVATVQVAPATPSLLKGGSVLLTARVLDDVGNLLSGRPVFWSTSDPAVAVVDVAGLVTGLAPGVATVTATSEARSAAVGITVLPVPVALVQLTPARDTVVLGQATQLTAVPRDSSGAPLDDLVTFTSSATTVATVSSSGLVLGLAPGIAQVTASAGGRTTTASITVLPRPVGAVIVSPGQSAITVGQTVALGVQITDASGNLLTGRPLSFQSSNVNVAGVSALGVVAATAPGTATITVTSEGKFGTASVVVSPSPIASLRIDPPSASLRIGGTQRLTASAFDAGGNPIGQRVISWTSGAPSVVTVGGDGLVTAVGAGTALIFAAAEGRLATSTMTVAPNSPTTVSVLPALATVIAGASLDLVVALRDATGRDIVGRTVQWTSSSPAIAIVSSTGRVRGVSPGTARIDATVDGVVGSSGITIIPVPVAAVAVNLSVPALIVGQAAQATAVARDAAGGVLTGRVVVWTSTNTAVATVSATGLVTALSVGSTTIRGTVETVVGSAPFTVVVGSPTTITAFSAVTQSATAGGAVAAPPTVRVTDAGGSPVQGVNVAFAVTSGGGTINPGSVATNASGTASLTSWTVGATAGANSVSASVPGLAGSPVTFIATGTVGAAATIAATSPLTQSVGAGTAVASPPSVRVTDAFGNPVSGVTVSFAVTAGGGAINATTVITNALGQAALGTWTLGGTAGANAVTATAAGLTGSPVTFTATGTVGAATNMIAASAVSQSAAVGTAVAAAPSVRVRDAGGNGVSGITVTFTLTSGGGTMSPASPALVVTNASGVATLSSWTLGTVAGSNAVTATVAGLTGSPVTFSATGVAGAATQLVVVTQPSGAASGAAFTTQPVVELRDANGNRTTSTAMVTVTRLTGTGVLSGTTSVAAVNGRATFSALSITGTGAHTLQFVSTAPAVTVNSASFTVTAAAPTAIASNSVTTQSANAGTAVAAPPSVRVRDAGNNPVSGVTVTFAITGGGGSISPTSVVTNASGIATLTSWTLGAVAGANSVSATAAGLIGSPVVFNATGTVGPAAAIIANSNVSQSAPINTAVSTAPSVRVNDAFGNGVAGASVTFTVTAGGGATSPASPAVVVTNASGIATLSTWTLGTSAGSNTVNAAATGLTGSPVVFAATATAGAATQIVANSVTTQTTNAGTSVAAPPSVRVRDAGNNAVSGVTVTFAVTGGGGSITPASVVTNASGIATLTSWTLGTVAGANTVSASVAGLTGTPVTFTGTGIAGAPSALAVTTQPGGAVTGAAFTTQPVVEIRDRFGNRTTSTAAVTVVRQSGVGTLSGTLTVNAVNGVATFAGLTITGGAASAHTLAFSITTPAATVTSASFVVTP
ncbi:MAG TPA: Ig-like domain-containing protein [Gemmatimonas sp.]|nr:Ig-like domain-containing protein [Gemmatimonas sp.]